MLLSRQISAVIPSATGQGGELRLMLFAPWCYGHHPTYLRYLIKYWQWQRVHGSLYVVVVPRFMDEHRDVVELVTTNSEQCIGQTVHFLPTTPEEQFRVENATSGYRQAVEQYRLVCQYAKQLQASQGLIMYFDSCQLPLVAGLSLPCPFSGIYFRPSFHYRQFSQTPLAWRERLQGLRERIFLSRLFSHPQFKTLFCLDPYAVECVNRIHPNSKAVYLPDPVEFNPVSTEEVAVLRKQLAIEPDRKVLLAFGRLGDIRKGTAELIKALLLLPVEFCRQLCLLLVGEPDPRGQAALEQWLFPLRQSLRIQIVTNYSYIPESEISKYFQLSDLILAPYQRHVGMSGILLLAAAAQKPVLSSDYGLMGELVRRHSLGLAVDTTCPSEIAKGLSRFLMEPADRLFAHEQARRFAEQNAPDQFSGTIFQHIQSHQDTA